MIETIRDIAIVIAGFCTLASILTALWFLGEDALRRWGWWPFWPALRRWWGRVTHGLCPDLFNIHPNQGRSK